jgi:hypothetical protein
MKTLSHTAVAALAVAVALTAGSSALAAKKKTTPQPVDNSPVVTPDTTSLPTGTAAPTGTVQVAPFGSAPPAPQAYAIPVGGAGQAQAGRVVAQPASASAPATPQAPPEAPAMARAEQCLIANTELVSRMEPSPKLAVDLLLTDVCAAEVDAASLYERNVEALARYNPVSERGRAGLSIARVDPETGQILAPPNVDVSSAVEAADRGALMTSPRLRKYAAELVLNEKARLAAGKKGR